MPTISIQLDDDLFKDLKKRADKSYLSVKEMAEDIVRRSMMSYSGGKKPRRFKVDDRLVEAFSKENRGRKRKR